MVEVISRDLKYTNGVVRNEERIELPMADILIDSNIHPITSIAKYIDNQNPEYNHEILFLASDFEELMNIIFSKKNSQSYSSANTILNDIDEAAYNKYFYEDREGVVRYARAGGNMN